MAKRKATSDFACPGCQSKFDTVTHIPFMGSCGHSLCAICVNEQEIKDCPTCDKPRGFVWKQKNDLAIGLLDALRQLDVKKFDGSATADFKCPGCHSEFDSEAHAPFVGSCGHSRCSYCVNDKDIKNCFVCKKRRGFAWKQRNVLATELLTTVLPQDMKKPKLDVEKDVYAPDEPIPAIVDPMNSTFLAQVVSHLDPSSFAKLARTCRPIYNVCFSSREIKIPFEISWIFLGTFFRSLHFRMKDIEGVRAMSHVYRPVNYCGKKFGFLGSAMNRKRLLQNYPFQFSLKELKYEGFVLTDDINMIRSFLDEFRINSIYQLVVEIVCDWDDFTQFLKFYQCKDILIEVRDHYRLIQFADCPISDDAAVYVLHNTVSFQSDLFISDQMILDATVPRLHLTNASISKETFMKLVEKFANSTEVIRWTIGCDHFHFGHYKIFKSWHKRGDPPVEKRPRVVDKTRGAFWILRKDGKLLNCSRGAGFINFFTDLPDYDSDDDSDSDGSDDRSTDDSSDDSSSSDSDSDSSDD